LRTLASACVAKRRLAEEAAVDGAHRGGAVAAPPRAVERVGSGGSTPAARPCMSRTCRTSRS
jgi:hypothetical protein